MKKKGVLKRPYRITLWKNEEIDYRHPLSDGYGIPAVVINCPIENEFAIHQGRDEYGDKIKGISFDECSECRYFDSFGFGQEIICWYKAGSRKDVTRVL